MRRLSSRTHNLHPFYGLSYDFVHSLLYKHCLRYFSSIFSEVCTVVIKNELIDVDLCSTSGDALLHQLRLEPIGPMQSDMDTTIDGLSNRLKPTPISYYSTRPFDETATYLGKSS